jgi:glycosyltransferase involved in cell wall biosynthesis
VLHKCYKDSFSASTALATTLMIHKLIGTYKNKVSAYIALNEFCKAKLVEMGIQENRIRVKPNFVLPVENQVLKKDGNPLFVGRLSKEKGVAVLAETIKSLPEQQFDIAGDGPEKHLFTSMPNVNYLGSLNQEDVIKLMLKAPFIMLPSLWYENMPRTIVEAFSCGTPVIASDIGALSTMIDHNKTGILFSAGSSVELAESIKWALDNKEKLLHMGNMAKKKYISDFTEDANYTMLLDIYNQVIKNY